MMDEGLIEERERRWCDQSPALVKRLTPGLSDDEIDRLSEPLDYSLPEEGRRWFRWHDGSSNRPVIFTRAFTPLRDSISLSAGFADMDETRPDG
jgi:cell wall assembly regulator SMI1